MQDPNADTEWNDALRKHGIIPEKKKEAEITEDEIIKMVEASCLLYTSPSPRDKRQSRMPSSA